MCLPFILTCEDSPYHIRDFLFGSRIIDRKEAALCKKEVFPKKKLNNLTYCLESVINLFFFLIREWQNGYDFNIVKERFDDIQYVQN